MANDIADFQGEAIAKGYTQDFAVEGASALADLVGDLRIADVRSFDTGTDPGDDVTIYLIESSRGRNGYLILSDSFHTDPRKAAFIDALLAGRGGGD